MCKNEPNFCQSIQWYATCLLCGRKRSDPHHLGEDVRCCRAFERSLIGSVDPRCSTNYRVVFRKKCTVQSTSCGPIWTHGSASTMNKGRGGRRYAKLISAGVKAVSRLGSRRRHETYDISFSWQSRSGSRGTGSRSVHRDRAPRILPRVRHLHNSHVELVPTLRARLRPILTYSNISFDLPFAPTALWYRWRVEFDGRADARTLCNSWE